MTRGLNVAKPSEQGRIEMFSVLPGLCIQTIMNVHLCVEGCLHVSRKKKTLLTPIPTLSDSCDFLSMLGKVECKNNVRLVLHSAMEDEKCCCS